MPRTELIENAGDLAPETEGALREVGIFTVADMRGLGGKEVCHRLAPHFPPGSSKNVGRSQPGAVANLDGLSLPNDPHAQVVLISLRIPRNNPPATRQASARLQWHSKPSPW